jgi:hypothetical protein
MNFNILKETKVIKRFFNFAGLMQLQIQLSGKTKEKKTWLSPKITYIIF